MIFTTDIYSNGKTIIFTTKDEDVGYFVNYEMRNSDFYEFIESNKKRKIIKKIL